MKAVIYARYSSNSQTEQSIEGQLHECNAFAKAHDMKIIDTYIDRAISGTTDNRAAFQKLIKDSDKRQFEAVIVYKLDRFTRNRYDAAMYKAKLKKNGVKVYYAKENIPDGPEGIILESLLEGMAEYYSAELAQKVQRGMRESALKCHSTGGNVALGYKVMPDKSFAVDEDKAPIVRRVFEMYDTGCSVNQICDYMNEQGLRTSRGAEFNKNSLRVMIQNERYIGVYQCKDIRIEGGIPAIVDKELFMRVQRRRIENKRAPAKFKGGIGYPLTTRLICGKCGSPMVGESGTSKSGDKHYYYICNNKKHKNGCNKKRIHKDWIENLVYQETCRHLLHPTQMKRIASRCSKLSRKEQAANYELQTLNEQLKENQKLTQNLMAAIEQGIITSRTKSRLMELEAQEEQLRTAITEVTYKNRAISDKEIHFMFDYIRDHAESPDEYQKLILEMLVYRVQLYDDKVLIWYNLCLDAQKSELDSSVMELPCSDLGEYGGGDGN